MALISHTLAGLSNGVSQQPVDLRFDSQGEAQVNMVSSLTNGTYRRPPMEWIAGLGNLGAKPYIHTINRDSVEKYVMVVSNGVIKVYDPNGRQFNVVDNDRVKSYLVKANGELVFRTIADTTFILNKSVITRKTTASEPQSTLRQALVYVKKGDYATDYTIKIDGRAVATIRTRKDEIDDLATNTIARQLEALYKGNHLGTTPSDVSVTREGNILTFNANRDFSMSVEDSQGNRNLILAKDKIQKFVDLPPIAPDGFTLKVTGDRTSSFDDYYVKFVREGSSGSWEETVKKGERDKPLASTMPIKVTRDFDNSGNVFFRASPVDWVEREAGDRDSVPNPTFIDNRINGMFFYQNRLGFITSENIVLSKNAKFFDFYATTATDVIDTDPIDVAISSNKVSNLYAAIPTAQRLLLFADNGQFAMSQGEVALTPSTVRVDSLTSYETDPLARPVVSGNFVYFPTSKEKFAGINRFFVGSVNESPNAEDVTINVPRFIEGRVTVLETSSTEQVLCCVTDKHPSRIYVFKFIQTGQENQQASWSYWDVGSTVKAIDIEAGSLNLVVQRGDDYSLQTIDLEEGVEDEEFDWVIHLDNRISLQGASLGEETQFALPAGYVLSPNAVAIRGEGFQTTGSKTNFRVEGDRIFVKGSHINSRLYVGDLYESYYTFSHPVYRDSNGNAINQGRLQIRDWTVEYINTGKFDVEVKTRDTERFLEIDNRRVSQTGINFREQPFIKRGKFKFLVGTQAQFANVTVRSREAHPLSILSAHWRGTYTSKAGRV